MRVPHLSWQAKARAKVADMKSMIPAKWILSPRDLDRAREQRNLTGPFIEQFLSDDEKEITAYDSVSLVKKIKCQHYSAVEVARAFCRRAAIAQQIDNCLHEVMFDLAIEIAEELDRYYAKHDTIKGPLHGLPVSLKDQFHVNGYDTTMGYVGWIGTHEGDPNPAKARKVNSQVVEELLSLGAVLYCKTSLPQTLLFPETVNNIIGRTLNPVNRLLSPGGSSGGEAGLQALGGSSVGLGTDLGGSVRIPASFCGTYAIKPSHDRISYRNVANTNPGQTTYASSVGVMGTSIDAAKLVLTSLLSTEPWIRDPNVVKLPWNYDVETTTLARANPDGSANGEKLLKIGVFWSDDVVAPHPPVRRGLQIVHDVLKNMGHKVMDWNPPSQATAVKNHLAMLFADGFHDIHQQLDLSGEPLVPPLRSVMQLQPPMSLLEYQDLTLQGKAYCEAYSDYWNCTGKVDGQIVDAVIMPVAPHAAVIPGKYFYFGYTQTANLMDCSAAAFPVTKADKDVDKFDPKYQPMNDLDRMNWEAYDPKVYHGAPVGLQVMARKWEEEKVWAIATIVDNCLKTAAAQ